MRQKSAPEKAPATQVVKNIRRATRRHFSAEDKIRIVLEGLRGGQYRRALLPRADRPEPILPLVERLSRGRVKDLRRETSALKAVVAELTLENRLLKKSVTADGEDAP